MTDSTERDLVLEYAGEEETGETITTIAQEKEFVEKGIDEIVEREAAKAADDLGAISKSFMDIQNALKQGGNVPLKVMLTREFKFLKMVNPQMDIDLKPATEGSAGIDLFACIEEQICLNRMGEREVIPTGIHIELPLYWEGQVRPRSGLAAKSGITVTNSPGTIDSDYRGEIKVILHNTSSRKFWVRPGDRIAQLVIKPVWLPVIEYVDDLSDTDRGEGGFGSTGS